ncbi:hypothetical protein OJ253_3392 [Cryptosporidium canis]|uniref:Ham1 family protein n=1 Tax=Cryptosporidium canis TaxID=195482 RepID=A0A9D5DG20_9CRYT|nr:hypothetical protein OJ253_3392 [Cryptosporidium canis]
MDHHYRRAPPRSEPPGPETKDQLPTSYTPESPVRGIVGDLADERDERFQGKQAFSSGVDTAIAILGCRKPTLTCSLCFKVYLVSGNKRKAEEFLRILNGRLNIELVDIDCKFSNRLYAYYRHLSGNMTPPSTKVPEIQGSPEEITIYKCKSAYERINGPVFVEDTSLCFNAYNGLPGPYVKWFLKSVGALGLFNMLQGYQDKSAYAMTLIGYFDGSSMSEPIIFQGKIDGEIVKPSGEKGFSWDPIFKPNGYNA